ncbi:hypothetical protein [Deinococcus aluminii]|uniref:Hpr(Ser) kinase/phosphatase n=1 Tax=Deinococcus aluminii TaxID=1656885 RepID=A0ABP9XBH1_9DEIO
MTDLPPFTSLDARVEGCGLDAGTWHELRVRWGHPAGVPVRRVVRIVGGPRPPVPDQPPAALPVPGGTLPLWTRGDQVWLGEHLHLEVTEEGVTLTGGPGVPEAAWVLAFVEAHRAGGWLPLHAAVLTRRGLERAVAVTGASGAGKSTAALRLAGAGLTILAEDQAWVQPASGLTLGLDTHLRAFEDSVRRFAPQWLGQAAGRDAHGKLQLPLTAAGGRATLDTLLVFGLPPQPGAAQRVRAVWEATGVPLTPSGRRLAAAGVEALLPRLTVRGVTREDVLAAVQGRLAERVDQA